MTLPCGRDEFIILHCSVYYSYALNPEMGKVLLKQTQRQTLNNFTPPTNAYVHAADAWLFKYMGLKSQTTKN